jgi:hypothetical protein
MTPSQFWSKQDRLESAFRAGRIRLSELMAHTTILGWQWHHNNHECLPARPLRSDQTWGIFITEDADPMCSRSRDYPDAYSEETARKLAATQSFYVAKPL